MPPRAGARQQGLEPHSNKYAPVRPPSDHGSVARAVMERRVYSRCAAGDSPLMSSKVRSESCIAGAEWRSGKPGPAKRDASRVALDKDDSVLRRHHDQRDAGDAVQRRSMAEDCPILRWVNDRPPDQGKHQSLICDEVRQRGWGGRSRAGAGESPCRGGGSHRDDDQKAPSSGCHERRSSRLTRLSRWSRWRCHS